MYIGLRVKYLFFSFPIVRHLNFLNIFSKNSQISNFMKLRSMRAELFHADGQTDMTKLTVAFRNFVNALRKNKEAKLAQKVTI
jgi:hypothetical protein